MPQPRNMWMTVSRVDILQPLGYTTTRITLQDAVTRSFTGSLSWDPSAGVVDGGLDAGAEAPSTWYYLYLVPRAADDTLLHVRGSVNAPTTGPAGYAAWRYVGSCRNNAASNLIRCNQGGARFDYYESIEPAAVIAFGAAFQDPKVVGVSLADVIPATASAARIAQRLSNDVQSNDDMYQELFVSGATNFHSQVRVYANRTYRIGSTYTYLPTPTVPKVMDYRSYKTGGICTIQEQRCFVDGWVDEWITGTG